MVPPLRLKQSWLGAPCACRTARVGPADRTSDTSSASMPTVVSWTMADHTMGADPCDLHCWGYAESGGATRPRCWTRRHGHTPGCEATYSKERVCAHGADGRPRWASSTPCSAIAMSRRMRTHRCGTTSCRAVATSAHGTAPVTASSAARWRGVSPRSPHTDPRERDEEI
jgi:hypothetical protein